MFEIYHADCITKLTELAQEGYTVNHIITDPPYVISAKNQFHTMSNRRGIDFGEWDWDFDTSTWIETAYPLLNSNGSMIIFCAYPHISRIHDKISELGGAVKDIIVWQKSNPMPRNTERRYVQDMEFALWAVHNKKSKWTFNKPTDIPYLRGF